MHPDPAHPRLVRRTPQASPHPVRTLRQARTFVEWVLNFAIWDLSLPRGALQTLLPRLGQAIVPCGPGMDSCLPP